MIARVLNIASVGLAVLLAWFVVRIGLGFLAPDSLEQIDMTDVAPLPTTVTLQTSKNDFSSDPFGAGDVAATPLIDLAADVPETTLQLTLMGRTTGPDGGAILRLPDGTEKRVGVEEELLPNVILKSVQAEYILLQVDGAPQRLTFEKVDSLVDTKSPSSVTPSPSTSTQTAARPQDLRRFMRDVRMRPRREGSRVIGMAVTARDAKGDEALAGYGLQDGDVITRIGTVDMTTMRTNMAEVQRLIAAGQPVDIQYLRNGQLKYARVGQ